MPKKTSPPNNTVPAIIARIDSESLWDAMLGNTSKIGIKLNKNTIDARVTAQDKACASLPSISISAFCCNTRLLLAASIDSGEGSVCNSPRLFFKLARVSCTQPISASILLILVACPTIESLRFDNCAVLLWR